MSTSNSVHLPSKLFLQGQRLLRLVGSQSAGVSLHPTRAQTEGQAEPQSPAHRDDRSEYCNLEASDPRSGAPGGSPVPQLPGEEGLMVFLPSSSPAPPRGEKVRTPTCSTTENVQTFLANEDLTSDSPTRLSTHKRATCPVL